MKVLKLIRINLKEVVIVGLILLFALFLRLYNLDQRTAFNADQEWLAFRARDVIKGDFPLLGPVTSVGSFSIGPGYVYLMAFIGLFTNFTPISGALLSVLLGVLFLLSLYLFIRHFVDSKTAYIILFLTTISFNLISWDQSPWAPSLFYFSQMIMLFGAYLSNKKQIGLILVATGFVMGFQSHFGVVLSIISIIFFLLFIRPIKPTLKTITTIGLILFFGFLPNLLFDITHNFTNLKRIVMAFAGDGVDYFVSFNKVISVLNFNTTSLIYPRNNNLIDSLITKTLFAIILVNAISLLRDKKFKNMSFLLLVTGILPASLFYIQQGKFSEYYLMMTVPSLILLLALFIYRIAKNKLLIALLIFVSVITNFKDFKDKYVPWNLGAKENVVGRIVEKGGTDGYGISLTTSLGNNFGFKYILDYYGVKAQMPPKQGETKIFSIIIPEGFDGMVGMEDYSGIGLRWSGI